MLGLRSVINSSRIFSRKIGDVSKRGFAKANRQGKPNSYEGIGYGNIGGSNVNKQNSNAYVTENGSKPPPPPPPPSTSFKGKIMDMWHKYGLLFIASYSTVYVSTLGAFFLLIDGNYLNIESMGISYDAAIDQFQIMVETYTGNTSIPAYVKAHPTAGKFLLAMGLTDMLEPIRLPAVVAAMPWLRAKLTKKSVQS